MQGPAPAHPTAPPAQAAIIANTATPAVRAAYARRQPENQNKEHRSIPTPVRKDQPINAMRLRAKALAAAELQGQAATAGNITDKVHPGTPKKGVYGKPE